jgi:hypothetical protein
VSYVEGRRYQGLSPPRTVNAILKEGLYCSDDPAPCQRTIFEYVIVEPPSNIDRNAKKCGKRRQCFIGTGRLEPR